MVTSTPPGSRTGPADVLAVLDLADRVGATLWLDGGWGVDALLGRQTREHGDLDLVVESRHVIPMVDVCARHGFSPLGEEGASEWNFLLTRSTVVLDLHVITVDAAGDGVLGPPERGTVYPAASLTGRGTVNTRPVHCVSAEWAVRFHDEYPGDAGDRHDVRALCDHFNLPVPTQYR